MNAAERVAQAALERRRAGKEMVAMYENKESDPQFGGVVISDAWGFKALERVQEKERELDEALDAYEQGKGEE